MVMELHVVDSEILQNALFDNARRLGGISILTLDLILNMIDDKCVKGSLYEKNLLLVLKV